MSLKQKCQYLKRGYSTEFVSAQSKEESERENQDKNETEHMGEPNEMLLPAMPSFHAHDRKTGILRSL